MPVEDVGENVNPRIYEDVREKVKKVNLVDTDTTLVEDVDETEAKTNETNRLLLLILKQLELITGEENYG